jgi:ketosteroid isomerase-like protein
MEKQPNSAIDRFRKAFQIHDPGDFSDITAEDCVLETPDGARYEGRNACVAFWTAVASDKNIQFEEERVDILGERALIFWRLPLGNGNSGYVRGVNIIQVRDGKIIETRGYVKSSEGSGL